MKVTRDEFWGWLDYHGIDYRDVRRITIAPEHVRDDGQVFACVERYVKNDKGQRFIDPTSQVLPRGVERVVRWVSRRHLGGLSRFCGNALDLFGQEAAKETIWVPIQVLPCDHKRHWLRRAA